MVHNGGPPVIEYAGPATTAGLSRRPVGPVFISFVVLLAAYTVWEARLPAMGPIFVPLASAWIVIGMAWLVRTYLFLRGRIGDGIAKQAPGLSRNMKTAFWIIVVIGLSLSDLPLRVGIMVSQPAMARLAATHAALPVGRRLPPQWVGVYYASYIEDAPVGGVQFFVGPANVIDNCGLTYSPTPIPALWMTSSRRTYTFRGNRVYSYIWFF